VMFSRLLPIRSSLYSLTTRSLHRLPSLVPKEDQIPHVTLVPGDGIGPEVTNSVCGVFSAAGVPIIWDRFDHHFTDAGDIQEIITSISRNGVCLKGPLFTPAGYSGRVSRNLQIRRALDMFVNIIPVKSVPGIKTRYENVDLVILRENTEGEYVGLEHEVAPGVVESTKVITHDASKRVAGFAFEYARLYHRKKVTAIHKANIQKLSDGEFLNCCREVSKNYPDITYNEMIVDNCSMQLVSNPQQFDIMLTPNLYGTIVSNIAAGLVGGPGLISGVNVGRRGQAIFESGLRHVGANIEGRDVANPFGMLFSACHMLRFLKLDSYADKIETAIGTAIDRRVLPQDLGGKATTKQLTQAVINNL